MTEEAFFTCREVTAFRIKRSWNSWETDSCFMTEMSADYGFAQQGCERVRGLPLQVIIPIFNFNVWRTYYNDVLTLMLN